MFEGSSTGDSKLQQQKSKFSYRKEDYKITWDEFLIETSEEERRIISFGISSVVSDSIIEGRPVFLEGFGVLYHKDQICEKVDSIQKEFELYSEDTRTIQFERCSDLVSYQREKYKGIIELSDLAVLVREKISFFVDWNERIVQRYIRGFIQLIKYEAIQFGISRRLSQIGVFYALHNRQGQEFFDWYSGADIFLISHFSHCISSKKVGRFVRPVFVNAWEPFEACCGKAIAMLSIDLVRELNELGYDQSALNANLAPAERMMLVSVFQAESKNPNKRKLIFVTDGLRQLGIDMSEVGTELILQIEVPLDGSNEGNELSMICSRPLVLSWVLLQGAKNKTLWSGAGLSASVPLFKDCTNQLLNTVFITPFTLIDGVQFATQGKFRYWNITALTENESDIVPIVSPKDMLEILKTRNLDQVVRLERSCLLAKSGVMMRPQHSLAAVHTVL
ncbi:MAG: hypothetical protein H6619_04460 [Deltaproteobacteria bacterium]|nr:hypothetical protein [Deltaproteobacteria bacterium]